MSPDKPVLVKLCNIYRFPSTHPSSLGLLKRLRPRQLVNSTRAGKESDLGNIIRTIVHLLDTTHASVSIRVRPLAVVPDASNRLAGDTGVETTALGSRTGEVIAEAALDKPVSQYIAVCLHKENAD